MNEFIEALRQAAPLVASILVPVVGLILKISRDRQDPGSIRSMKRHTEVLEKLPEEAKPAMVALITDEVRRYSESAIRKATRKLDGSALAALIFVGAVTGFVLYWLLVWASIWGWAYIFAVIWGLLGMALIIVGIGQLFYYGEKSPRKTREERQAERQAKA